MKANSLIQFLFLAGVHATIINPRAEKPDCAIKWTKCDPDIEAKAKVSKLPIECANLTAPLDYTKPKSNETITLELLRVPAAKPSKTRKTILLNFGGPGDAGRTGLIGQMDQLMATSGYNYDLVAFDPRGTVNTLTFTCRNSTEVAKFGAKYPFYSNSSDTALGKTWTGQGVIAETCYERKKKIGQNIGTAFTARDLMTVVDALGEDGLLRYWGFSYGTTLGATVAAMFPDRIEKMVLDGVQNAHEYYHTYDEQMNLMADESFSGFFQQCVKSPKQCALAGKNQTAVQLEDQFWEFLEKVKYDPVRSGTEAVDYDMIKDLVVASLYGPRNWPTLAKALSDLMNKNNATSLIAYHGVISGTVADTTTQDANTGIECGDKDVARVSSREDFMPIVHKKYNISKTIADSLMFSDMACAQWKMHAKERYSGDFHVKTKKPLLFIGNTWDPMTPYQSAHNMSVGFAGSGLIEQKSYGHASMAQPSACTIRAIREYFASGKVPEKARLCETDAPAFSNKTFADVLRLVDGKK